MLILGRTETESVLEPDAMRLALRVAMEDVSAGRGSSPPRIAAVVPDAGLLAAMPAYLPNGGGLAAKLVSLFPGNTGSRLPTHQAVVLVFDPESGEPLALLDGTSITTRRTAAGSALSAELLAREESETLAILGTGVQAQAHAEAMVRVRPVRRVRVAGRNPEHVAALCSGARVLARAGGPAGRQLRRRVCGRGHRLRRHPRAPSQWCGASSCDQGCT